MVLCASGYDIADGTGTFEGVGKGVDGITASLHAGLKDEVVSFPG